MKGGIGEAREAPRRPRRFRRGARMAVPIVLAAGLLGGLGPGPLSRGEARNDDGSVTIEFPRLAHAKSKAELLVRVAVPASPRGTVRLSLPRAWIDAVRIESIVPEPERTSADPEGLTYDFALAGPATIRFQHEFVRSGLVHGAVRAEGSPSLRFTQFVFP